MINLAVIYSITYAKRKDKGNIPINLLKLLLKLILKEIFDLILKMTSVV